MCIVYHSSIKGHQQCALVDKQSGEKYTDPFRLGWRDLKGLYEDIRKELCISTKEPQDLSQYKLLQWQKKSL
ncbi:hypothetical protein LEMLEM_LOCUS19032 [Lemmus lemmus]